MGVRAWNGAVLGAAAALWLASGTQREKAVIAAPSSALAALEAKTAANPESAANVRDLAQAYLDANAPGQALGVIASAKEPVRAAPVVEHVYARALLEEGRAADALAIERRVIDACSPDARGVTTCDAWLLASAMRRADILRELVGLGVEDTNREPEASLVAYHNATREARIAIR